MSLFARWRSRKSHDDPQAVYVSEKFGVRSLHIGSDTIQSSMRIAAPNDLELAYTRSMMGFLLFNDTPERVLMIGLGGGSLAKFIYHRLPQASTTVVEINRNVVAIARQHFEVPADCTRFTVVIGDGAEYMSRDSGSVDVVVVDGYDAVSHVAELSSEPFYSACRRRLSPGGVLVVNLWGSDRRFDDILRRMETAFPAGTVCLPAEKPGNIIVFAFRDFPGPRTWNELQQRARSLCDRYGLEFPRFVASLRKMNRHDERGLLL